MSSGKNKKYIIGISGIIIVYGVIGLGLPQFGHFSLRLPIERQEKFTDEMVSRFPIRLIVSGNQILNEDSQAVILKGIMPPDPAMLYDRGKFNRAFFTVFNK